MVDDGLKCKRYYAYGRTVDVMLGEERIYRYAMGLMKGAHIGGTLTEAEWLQGEKEALVLAREILKHREKVGHKPDPNDRDPAQEYFDEMKAIEEELHEIGRKQREENNR